MGTYLYLSMIPESLVASMLPPEEFGPYLAVGTRKSSRGQAMFFDLQPDFRGEHFDFSVVAERCVPHPDGRRKNSVYVAIYRVMEHVPLEAINSLWLVTPDARLLELKQGEVPSKFPGKYHLYQEICPVHPLIASSLGPGEFCRFITDPANLLYVPRLCFAELELSELVIDPELGRPKGYPYRHFDHLQDCFAGLEDGTGKHTKTVDRIQPLVFPYRCIKSGFFVGDQQGMLYYPFPSREELGSKYFFWV
jgi:hypothetical protein